jgi:hypothetical protein
LFFVFGTSTAFKLKKIAVPGKPLKRKLPGTDEEEKCEKNKRRASNGKETKYEMASIQPGRKFDDVQHLYGLLSG